MNIFQICIYGLKFCLSSCSRLFCACEDVTCSMAGEGLQIARHLRPSRKEGFLSCHVVTRVLGFCNLIAMTISIFFLDNRDKIVQDI